MRPCLSVSKKKIIEKESGKGKMKFVVFEIEVLVYILKIYTVR